MRGIFYEKAFFGDNCADGFRYYRLGLGVRKKEVRPVYVSDLVFGSYEIDAAVSNSELNAEKCILNVSGEIMTAKMTLAGNEVTALYFGSAEDARRAEESGSLSGAVYPDKDENGRKRLRFPC